MDLELADNCNYRCLECPISDDLIGRKINKLTDEDIDLILKSSAEKGALALKLNYINEPLLDIKRILNTAKKAHDYGFVDIYFTKSYDKLRTSFCPNPFRQLVVRADKSVLPCCSFWGDQMRLGMIEDDDSLGHLFNSKKMNEIRETFKNKDKKLKTYCEQCLSSCDPTTDD